MSYISFQPQDYFNTKLYTGNGSTNAITGVGFQPDWVWVKNRTDASTNHLGTDAVRGATKCLFPNLSNAEVTEANALQSFNSDGFTLGSDSSVNTNTKNWVSWNWKANGSGSSNTDGSINTTYTSANTTSGFSISTYTGNATQGATIGHGLGVAPAVVLVKRLNATSDWVMYHKGMGAPPKFIVLNSTAAEASSAGIFYNTAPTSSVFYVGDDGATNASGGTYVAYCFAEKKGFSKFGSYTGNGNADGTFVYTGFKPAMVLFKQSSASGEKWYIYDNKRNAFNITNSVLFPSASDAESSATTGAPIDILSNGFKLRGTDAAGNGSGSTYIYMAFSDQSIVSSNGVPAVAR